MPRDTLDLAREVTQRRIRGLQSSWGDVPLGFEPSDPVRQNELLDAFPQLFTPAFQPIDSDRLEDLAVASRLLSTSLLLADTVMDLDCEADGLARMMVRVEATQFEGYRVLGQLFGPAAPFWRRFRNYMAEYSAACLEEHRLVGGAWGSEKFSESAARRLAIGKNSPIRMPVAGLVDLARDEEPLADLVESLDQYSVALQMYDDVRDWKSDLRKGFPSLLLARAVETLPDPGDRSSPEFLRRTAREVYYGGHCRHVLELALEALEKASAAARRCGEIPWLRTLAFVERQASDLLSDIERIVDKNLDRVERQPRVEWRREDQADDGGWDSLAWDTLEFVLEQWRKGFGEARHVVFSSAEHRQTGEPGHQFADVFQRAIIADTLCDAAEIVGDSLRPVVEREADYLLSCHLDPPLAGWSYFPDLPEEPPDADDLAQVMQVLMRTGRREPMAAHAEPSLAVLFRDNSYDDGSFDTWIIPATGRTALHQRQAENARVFGGDRTPEVIANLLYALHLYDEERFADRIAAGTDFVERCQQAEGTWSSAWYFGPYYGTFACMRLLAAVRPRAEALERGVEGLRRLQAEDGGWGFRDDSDPLSTALALCALAQGERVEAGGLPESGLGSALSFLRSSRLDDSSWPVVPFIRLPGMPRRDFYGSRTITTSYVLAAALEWRRSGDVE